MEVLNKNIVKKQDRPIKIIQVGEGNFLRATFDYFVQVLNRETDFNGNIAIVQPRDSHKIGRFYKQDLMYDVITEGIQDGELVSYCDLIDVIGDAIDPYEDYEHFLSYAKSEDLQVFISNTTENGIVFDETDNDLSHTPTSYPAKLLAFLKVRYDHFNGSADAGLYIIPTELIEKNGTKLQEVLRKLADINNLDNNFVDWIFNSNKFYTTLVDRICPGYPKDDIDKWQEKWGYIDNLAVKGEVYHLYAIAGDKSLTDVLPFDKTDLNIIMCDDVKPYKELKVKILNGCHTFMLPTVYQLGFRVVNKTITDEKVRKLVDKYFENEILPSINLPETEICEFKNSVFDRFANPTIQHMWTSIMLNSMFKYKERILPVVNSYDGLAKYGLFGLASLITLYKLNVKEDLFSDNQEFLDMYKDIYENDKDPIDMVLNLDFWEYDFSQDEKDYVRKCYDMIVDEGMEEAFNWILSA